MTLIYPNIVPENNLRLPDALTIKHGPARLLATFVLEGDKAARGFGLRLRVRHDFDALVYLNKQHVANGSWYPLVDMFNPECIDLTPDNAFWISGENDLGDVVVTWAARIYYWRDTSLAEQACAMWYGRDEGQPCVVTAPAAKQIAGVVVCGGASWVRPDVRGKRLSRLIPRIGKAYAFSRWPIDWSFCYVTRDHVEKGLAASYGQQHLSYSIYYPSSGFGEIVLAYTPAEEVYEEFANFLTTELSAGEYAGDEAMPFPSILEHRVTKISPDGVFHGSSNRS